MGDPLRTLLPTIYMYLYETTNSNNNNLYSQYKRTYFRFVDDIFILFRGSR